MKSLKRKTVLYILIAVFALSVCMAFVCMKPEQSYAEGFSANLAVQEEKWQATGSGITFGADGFTVAATTADSNNRAIALKDKISGTSVIKIKYKASNAIDNLMVQFKDARDSIPAAVGYSQGGTGHRLLVDLRGIAGYSPNYGVVHYKDGGQPFPQSEEFIYSNNNSEGVNPFFNGEEQELIIETEDVDNGVKISVKIGDIEALTDRVIEDTSIKGEYYLAIGTISMAENSEFTITSVEIDGLASEPNPDPDPGSDLSGNVALKEDLWQSSGSGITLDGSGISIAATAADSNNRAVALKTKINSSSVIKIKFKATAGLDNFMVQFKDVRDSVPTAVGYSQGGAGHRLLVDLRGVAEYSPNYGVMHYQDGGQTFPNYPNEFLKSDNASDNINEYFDGAEHEIIIETEDVENGVKISVKIGDIESLADVVVEDTTIKGDYYLAFGVISMKENTCVTVTGVEIEETGVTPPAPAVELPDVAPDDNLLTDGYGWNPKATGATFGDEGLIVTPGTRICSAYSELVQADAEIDLYFESSAASTDSEMYIIFKDNSDMRDGKVSNPWEAKVGSRRLALEILDGAIFLWDYTVPDDPLNEWALPQYAVKITSKSIWPMDGKLHRINIVTEDLENGIKVTVKYDNAALFEETIDNAPELKGDYDLTVKVVAAADASVSVPVLTATGAKALHKEEFVKPVYDEKYNLAKDYYSWILGSTISTPAKSEMSDNGITLSASAETYPGIAALKATQVGDYKVSMLFNSNLIPPAEGKAQTWRYSYVELVCKNEMTACSPSVTSPYGGGTCYYSLRMGWESQYALEGQTCFGIYKHRGYSDGTPIGFAVNRTDINISDGKDHYLEMTVKDVQNEEGNKGVNIIVRLDGDLIFDFVDYDKKITETVTIDDEVISVEYDWKASGMTGWIGIASISDYMATLPEEERPGSFTIKEYYITKYDEENPEGVMVERAKVDFEPPMPGDYGDPDEGRDPADNQSAGLPVNVDSNNGCNSQVRAESALIALPLLAVSSVILTVKRRRGRKVK